MDVLSGNETHHLAGLMPSRDHSVVAVMSGETLCVFYGCRFTMLNAISERFTSRGPLTKTLCPFPALWGHFVVWMRPLFTVGIKGPATQPYVSLHHLASIACSLYDTCKIFCDLHSCKVIHAPLKYIWETRSFTDFERHKQNNHAIGEFVGSTAATCFVLSSSRPTSQ